MGCVVRADAAGVPDSPWATRPVDFLTAGTWGGNSGRSHPKGLYRIVFPAGSERLRCDRSPTRNDRVGTAVPAQPSAGAGIVFNYVQQRETRMSNQNQNPGQ